MKVRKIAWSLGRILLLFMILTSAIWIYLAQPTLKKNARSSETVSPEKLENHVRTLSVDYHPRHHQEVENLNKCAAFISDHFKQAGARARYQGFAVRKDTFKNVVGVFNEGAEETIIIGAHYDSCYENITPGADDNASGVAGLIELAYLLGKTPLDCEIQLVAYTLEEPPHFASQMMGSYHHAVKVTQEKKKVRGVIVLEMIGYFSDERGSQTYPSKLLNLMYPTKGNFIAVVSRADQRAFTQRVKTGMKGATDLPIYSLNAPAMIPGIDFSDHRNYWEFNIPAVMVTDTSFYRNKTYHKPNDTAETLNYDKMAQTTVATFEAVKKLAE